MVRRVWLLCVSIISLLGFALVAPAGATSDKAPGPAAPPDAQTQNCVEVAKARNARAWACVGSTLLADGKPAEVLAPMQVETTSGPSIQDDYDSWCEATGKCNRKISSYIMETKANIWYGYGGKTVGSYDAVLRINLNGRQAQFKVSLIWDNGPPLYFSNVEVDCFEEIAWLPDRSCGVHRATGGAYIHPGSFRWNSGTLYGNRLANSNEYYAGLAARWTPTGHPQLAGQLFESPQFNCYGNDNCYFP